MGKEIGLWSLRSPSCKPSIDCDIPLMRGDWVDILKCEVIVEVVFGSLLWEVEIVLESLKCEVIGVCWLSAYPSCVRWILYWLCIAFSERLYLVDRGVVYFRLYLPQILSGGSLCGQVSENPSVWRRGRRAGCSNLETYPCVSEWSIDYLTLSLLCALHHFILLIHYMLALFVCASLVFNHESFI